MLEKVWPTPAQAPGLPGEADQREAATQRPQETGAAGLGDSQDAPADGIAPSMHAGDGADGHQSLADGTGELDPSNAGQPRVQTGAGDGDVRIPPFNFHACMFAARCHFCGLVCVGVSK